MPILVPRGLRRVIPGDRSDPAMLHTRKTSFCGLKGQHAEIVGDGIPCEQALPRRDQWHSLRELNKAAPHSHVPHCVGRIPWNASEATSENMAVSQTSGFALHPDVLASFRHEFRSQTKINLVN